MRPSLRDVAVHLQRATARSSIGIRLTVRIRDFCRQVVFHRLYTTHLFDANGELLLLRTVAPNVKTFVDVGANVGDWSAALLEAAPSARGLLVEPSENAHARLFARMRGDARVEIVKVAAGATDGSS